MAYPYWLGSQKDLQSRRAVAANTTGETAGIIPQLIGQDQFPPGDTTYSSRIPPNIAETARLALTRVARASNTPGEYGGVLPQLVAKDTFPNGRGGQVLRDEPNPSFAILRAQAFVALNANSVAQIDTPLPSFVGQDKFFDGPGNAPDFDWPIPSSAVIARQSFIARLSADAGNWNGPLPLIGAVVARPTIPVDTPTPSFVVVSRQSTVARSAADLGQFDTPLPTLFGQDALTAGEQSFALPTPAVLRARDYSIGASFPLELIGQDALAPGGQLSGNPPAGTARAATLSEPGVDLTIGLASAASAIPPGQIAFDQQYRTAPRARDYSVTAAFFHGLDGQDALAVGEQISGNAPAGPLRASTLSEPGVNLTALLTAAPPTIPYGLSTALTALAPYGPLRAREYGQTTAFFHGLDGKDALPVGRSTAATELPPKAPARARDYSFVAAFPLTLVGRDALYGAAGEAPAYDWQLPPHAAPRSFALYDPGVNLAVLAPTPTIPVGEQSFELPPRAAARARDYSFTASYFAGLIGKDALPSGHSTANTDLPPKAAARARDYTWLQTAPLYVYQQLPPGASTESSVVPPRGPARARDYTFLRSLPIHLIGQDSLYGAPGEVPAYDWQLPTPAAPRSRDYTLLVTAPYGRGIAARDLIYTLGTPGSAWQVGAFPPSSHWLAGLPSQ